MFSSLPCNQVQVSKELSLRTGEVQRGYTIFPKMTSQVATQSVKSVPRSYLCCHHSLWSYHGRCPSSSTALASPLSFPGSGSQFPCCLLCIPHHSRAYLPRCQASAQTLTSLLSLLHQSTTGHCRFSPLLQKASWLALNCHRSDFLTDLVFKPPGSGSCPSLLLL